MPKNEPITINDPVHGYIVLSPQEVAVIDTPIFQRLRYVKQLGVVHYIYPGGVHDRFQHCIGAFHIAGLYCQRLFPSDQKRSQTIKLAALLHDSKQNNISILNVKSATDHLVTVGTGPSIHRSTLE
jgi:HD superfamily phosphohydrolase